MLQGPGDCSSDAAGGQGQQGLGALRDLLPALAALAPTNATYLVNGLLRWRQQQQRSLGAGGSSSGSGGGGGSSGGGSGGASLAWRSQTLQLAFWHAVHRVLAPLPPGALPAADIPPLLEARPHTRCLFQLNFEPLVAGFTVVPEPTEAISTLLNSKMFDSS